MGQLATQIERDLITGSAILTSDMPIIIFPNSCGEIRKSIFSMVISSVNPVTMDQACQLNEPIIHMIYLHKKRCHLLNAIAINHFFSILLIPYPMQTMRQAKMEWKSPVMLPTQTKTGLNNRRILRR